MKSEESFSSVDASLVIFWSLNQAIRPGEQVKFAARTNNLNKIVVVNLKIIITYIHKYIYTHRVL